MTTTQRLAELQEYARQDGERWNEGSIADFLAFPQRIETTEGPYLFLEENGNLRAVWRSMTKRFGIEFFGEEKARLLYASVHSAKQETYNFNLADIPNQLTPKRFLAFVRENAYEEDPEEVASASNY